ncbi:DUF4251 domain-containing protein [uncultured Winogradskyella sp.]|uniref:DUF4251 domain-containing protein n=1 Tax=uncultured Winogradskyella sp. TaxID=395353 RepID=UPI0030DCD7E3|tara:strand:+ start:106 stop:561 length:456 start_codon:yes stop_codon:yes gene_type:complete
MKNLLLLTILLSISATTYTCAQTRVSQKEKFQATYNNSKALVKSLTFKYVGEVVYNNKQREMLDGNTNTISIDKSKVSGQVVSLSNANKTFDIEGELENYKVSFNDDNQRISIEFSVNTYQVFIDIKPNGNAFLTVSDNIGNNISWTGRIK